MTSTSPKVAAASGTTASGYPVIPATTPLAHTAIQLRILINALYTRLGLIEVLQGGLPPKADEIVVVPMDDIGEPPPDRIKDLIAYRLSVEKNRVAIQTKTRMLIEARNLLYAIVQEMLAPHHQGLTEQIYDLCNMGSATYGIQYFDGVRADAMMNRVIVPPGGKSEEDKAFYKLALKIQEENPLPDHCTKETYTAKANAYVNYIRPNLPYAV